MCWGRGGGQNAGMGNAGPEEVSNLRRRGSGGMGSAIDGGGEEYTGDGKTCYTIGNRAEEAGS